MDMTRAPLTGADLYDWIALRRVSRGGIARTGDCWADRGRRVPGYVAEALTALCEAGLVALADPDAMTMARAVLTHAGTNRFEQLVQQRQQALQAPTAQSVTASRGRAAAAQIGFLVAVCRLMAQSMPTEQGHKPPDSGWPPVEQPPRQTPAPGSRTDVPDQQ